jgi:hypothetical protein
MAKLTVEMSAQALDGSPNPKLERLTKSAISRVMSEMGRKGGRIGGKRKLETLSAERRKEIALNAARARWANNGKH